MKSCVSQEPGKNRPAFLLGKYWMALALVVLTFAVYGNSLQNQFVFDDLYAINHNAGVGAWADLGKVFVTNYQPWSQSLDAEKNNSSNYYRPIILLSFGLSKLIWGQNPFPFHLTNVIMMALLAVFWYALVWDLSSHRWLAFLASLLYLLNPIHTEVVAFINGRTDLTAALFIIGSLYFYWKWRKDNKIWRLIVSVISWLVALGSKEIAVVFPVILLSMELLQSHGRKKNIWRFEHVYYLAIFLLFLTARYLVLKNNLYWQKDILDFSAIGTIAPKNWRYLKLILWPADLSTYYTEVFKAGLSGWIGSLLLLALPAVLIYLSRKWKDVIVAFSSVLFLWGSLPAMGLVRNTSNVEFGERFVFFSSLGIALLLAWAFVKLIGRIKQRTWKYATIVLLVIYGSFLGYKTVRQNRVWESDHTLFREMARTSPQSFLAHFNLANEYAKRRQADSAIVHYQKAMEIRPDNIDAVNNLGVLYFMMGKYAQAEGEYKKAAALSPRSPVVYYNIGLCYQQRGLVRDASHWYRLALEKDPFFRPAGSALEFIENDSAKEK
ncbi:MAG: tetratricopeptide repeat protein [Candidatus Edwardsbacteria bacterium]|nr:tetratricopeptide repeat protein [Candidatus Edwardsbacteria bacterium]